MGTRTKVASPHVRTAQQKRLLHARIAKTLDLNAVRSMQVKILLFSYATCMITPFQFSEYDVTISQQGSNANSCEFGECNHIVEYTKLSLLCLAYLVYIRQSTI